MAKLLVHKRDTVESVTVNGLLQVNDEGLFVVGASGEKVDLTEILTDFDGEEIAFAVKNADKVDIEVIE